MIRFILIVKTPISYLVKNYVPKKIQAIGRVAPCPINKLLFPNYSAPYLNSQFPELFCPIF